MFDYENYESKVQNLANAYQSAEFFPHIVLDDFIDASILSKAKHEFPAMDSSGWIHYKHFNENKVGLNKKDLIPPTCLQIIEALNSQRFVTWLSQLTGINNLIPDPHLEGGGLHQIARGGFLNIHADFTVHPHQRNWRRRVNVLLYLNENWQPSYGGNLELWSQDMRKCFREVAPIFNRCVIFNTDVDSFHGHPSPLQCPENETRKSIALYYFSEEEKAPRKITTNYQARPEDGFKSILIYLDKKALALYSRVKSLFGINDNFISSVLNKVNKLNFFKKS